MKRRSYLQITGAAAVGSSFVGNAAAHHTTYDVVSDLGVDNTGKTAIDSDIKPYLKNGTRLEFPDGRYRIDQLILYKLENFHFVATGDATLVPGDYPTDGSVWIGGAAVRNLRFANFDIDSRNAGPKIAFGAKDGLLVKNITKYGAHTTKRHAFIFSITRKDGYGRVEGLRATDGDVYGDSVGAVGVYTGGKGSILFKDCEISGWGDNGLYGSNASGPVMVDGGTYSDNNISQVRVSSPGSYVRDVTIKADKARSDCINMRGAWVCSGTGPVEIDNCDISMLRGEGGGGIVAAYDGGSLNISNTRVHVEPNYTTVGSKGSRTSNAILFDVPSGIDDPGTSVIENTSVTGGGSYGSAIRLRRGDTTIRNSCINQDGTGRDGIEFDGDYSGYSVSDTSVSVTDSPLVRNGASVSTSNLTYSGSCPLPSGVTYDQYSASLTTIADVPIPGSASRMKRPTMGTSKDNTTANIFGRYDDDGMRSFVDGNLSKLIQDFIVTGGANFRFRMIPANADEAYLTKVGLAVWDKEPGNYWSFMQYLHNNDNLSYGSPSEVKQILKASGVRNYGWLPWLADDYTHIVNDDIAFARKLGVTSWDDFPPALELNGDVAAPQYSYVGGIKTWLDRRL